MKSGSTRGNRTDGLHLALVLEGGGMRGVISVAMASAFEERGCLPAFDSVHGSSAGACGAAYFAAGQASVGARIYFEDINNKRFIDPYRPLLGRPIMNKDFLIDYVMTEVKPLDASPIAAAPGFLNVVATRVETGEAQIFQSFKDKGDILAVLKASICLPIIAGRSVALGPFHYVDGGIVQQVAIESAAATGATHAIVLMTRGADELERPLKAGLQLDARLLGACYGPALEGAYRRRNWRINETIRAVRAGRFDFRGGHVLTDSVVCPNGSARVGRLTTDGGLLRQAFKTGVFAAAEYLDAD
jgi:predicted patatin/cPLA2 family phospholipase